jgi:uracil-DNA glycosylase
VLDEQIPLLKTHGSVIKKGNKYYFITLHPAAAIRFQKFRKIFEEDFQKLKDFIMHNLSETIDATFNPRG